MAKDLTPYTTGQRLNLSTIDAAYTVLQSDSSKVFMLNGGPYTITLPVAAALEEGWYCKFVVKENTPSGDITITAGSAIVDLVMKDIGGDASNSTAGTQVSNIIIGTAAKQGDYIDMFHDGTSWYAECMSSTNNSITTS